MSELRKPVEIIKLFLPVNAGKKTGFSCTLRVELYPASCWRNRWEPCSTLFYPKVPLKTSLRRNYWETRYRIRVNGRWRCNHAKYETFTREEILEKLLLQKKAGQQKAGPQSGMMSANLN
ncbi:MAG: hypothetical protein WC340_15585 [Kiritimatiellia bacterium]